MKTLLKVVPILLIGAFWIYLWPSFRLLEESILTSNTATVNIKGKTRVFRYNGVEFERLHEFCTWTQPFDCTPLKTPAGPIPIFIHDAKNDVFMSTLLVRDGARDTAEIAVIMRELKKHPEAIFVDIGANLGIYTLTIAKTLKRQIIAVEPVIQSAAKLCKSIQQNRLTENIALVFNPLSDWHKVVTMEQPPDHLSASMIVNYSKIDQGDKGSPSCDASSPMITAQLDDLIQFTTSKTAILKIDVESYEYHVINGGLKFLEQVHVPAIFMEWFNVQKTGDASKLVGLMKEKGYIPHVPQAKGNNKPLSYDSYRTWPFNVIWLKN